MFTIKVYPNEFRFLDPNMVMGWQHPEMTGNSFCKVRILQLDYDKQEAIVRVEQGDVCGLDFGQKLTLKFSDLCWIIMAEQEAKKLPKGTPVLYFLNEDGERNLVQCVSNKRPWREPTLRVTRIVKGDFYYHEGQEFPLDPLSIIMIS